MSEIVLRQLSKHYDGAYHAVKGIDLTIADKEFVVLVGPSGCGKSTTLRMIAGLEDISGGEIRIGDRIVNDLPPKDRDVAMVFQNYALYQHMTVYDNLAFGLRNKKIPEPEIKTAIDRAAGILGLDELMHSASRASCRAASSSASRSGAASCATRRCSCSMSRSPTWTPSCARRCAWKSSACAPASRRPRSSSPTIRSRR